MCAVLTEQSLELAAFCCSFFNVDELLESMMRLDYGTLDKSEKTMLAKLVVFKEIIHNKKQSVVSFIPADAWQQDNTVSFANNTQPTKW